MKYRIELTEEQMRVLEHCTESWMRLMMGQVRELADKERAIIMAYTGVCMLEGERLDAFYQYLAELYERPVYTHEWLTLDIKEKSRPDFIRLCEEEQPERKKGKWIYGENSGQDGWYCSECGGFIPWCYDFYGLDNIDFIDDFKTCPFCDSKMVSYTGADMRGEED